MIQHPLTKESLHYVSWTDSYFSYFSQSLRFIRALLLCHLDLLLNFIQKCFLFDFGDDKTDPAEINKSILRGNKRWIRDNLW